MHRKNLNLCRRPFFRLSPRRLLYDFRMTFLSLLFSRLLRPSPISQAPILRGLSLAMSLVAFLSLAPFKSSQAQEGPQLNLPRVSLSAGMHQISAQVAQTPVQRQIGLMNRKDMPQHEGMLFVFEEPAQQCFWMKNTLLPLTAAFLADDGTIVNLADMKPQTLNSHCSAQPVRYVLEMNQGWFMGKAIKPGMRLSGAVFEVRR